MRSAQLEQIYAGMWRDALPALRRNLVCPEPLPAHGDARWGLSAILRTDAGTETARRLLDAAGAIAVAAGPHQIPYGPDKLHVTLRSLEGFRGTVTAEDPAVARYAEAIEAETRTVAPIAFRFCGVAPTSETVRES